MVAAIGTTSSPAGYEISASGSISGLEAQLARYQKELSNCVNCDSAKTAKGKENIQAISGKISSIQTRIEKIQNTPPAKPPSESNTSTAQTTTPSPADKPIGSLIDVQA